MKYPFFRDLSISYGRVPITNTQWLHIRLTAVRAGPNYERQYSLTQQDPPNAGRTGMLWIRNENLPQLRRVFLHGTLDRRTRSMGGFDGLVDSKTLTYWTRPYNDHVSPTSRHYERSEVISVCHSEQSEESWKLKYQILRSSGWQNPMRSLRNWGLRWRTPHRRRCEPPLHEWQEPLNHNKGAWQSAF